MGLPQKNKNVRRYKRRPTGRPYSNRRWGFEVGGYADLKKQVYAANVKANFALSKLNTELKRVETTATWTTNIDNLNYQLLLLNPLSQGVTSQTRTGDQVKFKSLDMRMWIRNTVASTNAIRILVFKDLDPDGATITSTDVLDLHSILAHRNMEYTRRFIIYHDQVYNFAANTYHIPVFEKLHVGLNKVVKKTANNNNNITSYSLGNAGTIADISQGAYYIMALGATASSMALDLHSRMRYLDN